jgi:hypothetical protein
VLAQRITDPVFTVSFTKTLIWRVGTNGAKNIITQKTEC